MQPLYCEVCGSNNILVTNEDLTEQTDFGTRENYSGIFYKCNECHCNIATKETEENRQNALDRSVENSIYTMLHILENQYSFTTYERILNIEFGTMEDWKNKVTYPSSAEIAFLTILTKNIEQIVNGARFI